MHLPHPTWRARTVIVAFALLATVAAVPVAMAAVGRDTPPSRPGQNVPVPSGRAGVAPPGSDSAGASAGSVDPGYWTDQRMREASGATMPTDK